MSNGVATLNISTLAVGGNTLLATYPGDSNFKSSSSSTRSYTVTANLAQTITFPPPPTPAYVGTSVLLTATGGASGNPVVFTVISGPATASGPNGSILTYTSAGTVVLEADQAASGIYTAAPPVQLSVTTTPLTEPVGTTSPTITTILAFRTTGTLSAINVLTLGAPNLDFKLVSGGSCTVGATYTAGQTCTVAFTFTPTLPGARYGGISLTTSAGALLASTYVAGTGIGPQVNYLPATPSLLLRISVPGGFAFDGSGNLFVTNTAQPLTEYLASTAYATSIPITAPLIGPRGIAIDGLGNLFLTENSGTGGDVREVFAAGGYTTSATLGSGFNNPLGIAVDANANVFVSDGNNIAVKEILAASGYATVLTIGSGFSGPDGLALDSSGNVFVADSPNSAIKEILAASNYTTVVTLPGFFLEIAALAVTASDNVIAYDLLTNKVTELTASSGYTNSIVLTGGVLSLNNFALDGTGNVYFGGPTTNGIQKLDFVDPPTLTFKPTYIGSTSADSPQTVTQINNGNAPLIFSTPSSGNNPAITPGFTLNSASTCPQLSSASQPATLAIGATCTNSISFTPIAVGPDNGFLTTTDNVLSSGASQLVPLNGVGLALTPTLTFSVPNHTVGDAPFPVAATSNSTGTITYSVSSGPATISASTVTLTGPGTVVLLASQAAAGIYTAATATATFTVAPRPQPSITVSATPNPVFLNNSINLTATLPSLNPAASGTITFLDGTQPIGTAPINNQTASISIATLTLGVHSVTASYGGSTNYAASTSSPVAVTVEDFALSFLQPNVTINHGGTATFLLNLTSPAGTASAINLTATGTPNGSVVTFTPATVPTGSGATGSGPTQVTLTIQTPNYPTGPWQLAALLVSVGLLFPARSRRKQLRRACITLLTTVTLAALAACGSGWQSQTWTINVTATSGNLSHTATATLNSVCSNGQSTCPVTNP